MFPIIGGYCVADRATGASESLGGCKECLPG